MLHNNPVVKNTARRFINPEYTPAPPDLGARRTFVPKETIFREGEPGDCAYIIDKGVIEIIALVDGNLKVLGSLGPGELFGEMALIDKGVRSASAVAISYVELIAVTPEYVNSKISGADPLMNLLLKVVLKRFRHLRAQSNELVMSSASEFCTRGDGDYEKEQELVHNLVRMNSDLSVALLNHDFDLHYQPIVDLRTGEVVGLEALARWFHPERGMIPPDQFIGVAEETGLIVALGTEIFRKACSAIKRIEQSRAMITPRLFMSINVSIKQMADEGFVSKILSIMDEAGVEANQIKLEITESLMMKDPESAFLILSRLEALGFRIATDDFGTGYSSLSYLHRFPIHTLKVDRSFVMSITDNRRSLEIVKAITRMALALNLNIVAEGIERPEELAILRELGCQMGQGYLFSKAVPEEELAGIVSYKT